MPPPPPLFRAGEKALGTPPPRLFAAMSVFQGLQTGQCPRKPEP